MNKQPPANYTKDMNIYFRPESMLKKKKKKNLTSALVLPKSLLRSRSLAI